MKGEPLTGLSYMITAFLAVFGFGFYIVNRYCLRPSNSQVMQSEVRAARRAVMKISYESSDGYSGSEMEFDDSRAEDGNSNYSAGDVSIEMDGENGVIDWP